MYTFRVVKSEEVDLERICKESPQEATMIYIDGGGCWKLVLVRTAFLNKFTDADSLRFLHDYLCPGWGYPIGYYTPNSCNMHVTFAEAGGKLNMQIPWKCRITTASADCVATDMQLVTTHTQSVPGEIKVHYFPRHADQEQRIRATGIETAQAGTGDAAESVDSHSAKRSVLQIRITRL